MEQEHQFIDYIEQSIIKNWDKDALTDYKGITLQYKDVARKSLNFTSSWTVPASSREIK